MGVRKKPEETQSRTEARHWAEPNAAILFSLRQMRKLNPSQSSGRDRNDLNVLAYPEATAEENLPRQ